MSPQLAAGANSGIQDPSLPAWPTAFGGEGSHHHHARAKRPGRPRAAKITQGDLLLPLSRRGAAAVDLDLNPSGPDQISSQPKSHPPTAAGDLLATANPLRTAVGGGGRWTPLPPRVTAGRGLRRRRLTTGASPRGVLSDGGGSGRRWRGRAEGGVDGDSPGAAHRRRRGGARGLESSVVGGGTGRDGVRLGHMVAPSKVQKDSTCSIYTYTIATPIDKHIVLFDLIAIINKP